MKAYGFIGRKLFVLVYAERGEKVRAISLRIAKSRRNDAMSRGNLTEAQKAELRARIKADIESTTDEEDAAIHAAALTDPDNLPNQFPKRVGRPPAAVTKQAITLRIDREVIAKFRATGEGWQTRMNDALKRAASRL